jgi:murein L,D-transpeptidase YcbB/YkuD
MAVVKFQLRFGLKPDGTAGQATWRYLIANER